MKARAIGDAVQQAETSKNHSKSRWKKQKRNEQRLGGKGLSLEAFANAKSRPAGYNPAVIKKQREFYKNAKYVRKYKKAIKQENFTSDHMPITSDFKDGDRKEDLQMPSKRLNKSSRGLREEYEKKHAEDEKARMEREAILQAKRDDIEKAEARRKAQREKMFKKTRSGQPVMKHRITHLLDALLETSKQ